MNFTSQICTTREQSERLIALGLKKETADMVILEHPRKESRYFYISKEDANWDGFPAWSLSRLLAMFPSFIDIGEYTYIFRIIQGKLFSYRNNIAGDVWLYSMGGVYNSAIYTIEWLIGEGCFNKEYLE